MFRQVIYVFTIVFIVISLTSGSPPGKRRFDYGKAEYGGDNSDDIIYEKGGNGNKFNMLIFTALRWDDGIVYYKIPKSFPTHLADRTREAMDRVKSAVNEGYPNCIDFRRKTSSTISYYKLKYSTGCAAGIGQFTGESPVFIADGCTVGNMMHEMLHVLGVFHEHTRQDRDAWVTVDYNNILYGAEVNFDISPYGTDLGTHYDYGSIMHYSERSFAKTAGTNTITPLDATAVIGQREDLSACDVERIRVYYGCKTEIDVCRKSDLSPP